MKAKLTAAWAASVPASRREPTASEISTGFPCGPADIGLFNEQEYRRSMVEAELSDLVTKSGLTPSESDLLQVAKSVRSQRLNLAAPGGTANAITATLDPAPASWAELEGAPIRILPLFDNTGAATFAPNGMASRPILHRGGALIGGELRAGVPVEMLVASNALHIIGGGASPYVEKDVTTGGYALPALAATPQGYEMTLRLTGTPVALPMPAITVSGGGNIIWRGVSTSSMATFGRGETLRFRRVADGYLMTVLAQSQRAALLATDGGTTWVTGPLAYGLIPVLSTVSGEAQALFGFDGQKCTLPVTGQYFIQLRGQFNASGGSGGAGVVITLGAFVSTPLAMNYSYSDYADTFSVNHAAVVTHVLSAGDSIQFSYALTNAASRVRAQDFGINVIYLGR